MTDVVIGDILPYTQATASGGQTVFGTNWTANVASDVVVYQTPANTAPNDVTQKLNSSQYSVAFIGGSQQVQVTLVSGANAGDIITITRQTPADRMNLYSNTNFTPTMLNNDFGILTLVDQQAQLVDQLIGPRYNYSAQINTNTPGSTRDTILPLLLANQTWAMNPGRTAIIGYTLPPVSSGIAPADATYILKVPNASLPNAEALSSLGANGLLAWNNGSQVITETQIQGTANQIAVANGDGNGTIGLSIPANPIMPGVAGMGIPIGTTAQRTVPVGSSINLRFNTDLQLVEYFYNGAWTTISNDTALLALLASHTVNEGASLIGLQNQSNVTNKTVQDLANAPLLLEAADGSVQNGFVLTAGSGVTLTPGSGTLTVSSTGGTVVSISQGSGIICTPNPITGSGSVALNTAAMPAFTMAASSNIAMNSNYITGLHDPQNPQDAATMHYVDTTALNGTSVYAASAGSLGTVTQSGAGPGATLTNAGAQATFALDGTTPPVGVNVLIKNTATGMTAANEGIYTVTNAGSIITNWVLTRATDFDTAVEINNTGLILIRNGSTLAGTAWYNAATITNVDTDNFSFSQFGNIIFPVSVAQGGTGNTSFTAYSVICAGTTSTGAFQNVSGVGSSGQVLTSNGAAALPTWQNTTGGTVTSVTFTGDGTVLSSNPSSAVTTSGTLTATIKNQSANTVLAGPTSGGATVPTFRGLNYQDMPYAHAYITNNGTASITGNSHNVTSVSRTSQGVVAITFSVSGGNFWAPIASITGTAGYCIWGASDSTHSTVSTYNSSDTLTDLPFAFIAFPT